MMNSPSDLLDEALALTTTTIPNRVIHVEDRVETSGAFVLHHLIKRSLSPQTNTCLLFIAFSHYDRIMRKMVYNLSLQRENKRRQFLDMLNLECPESGSGSVDNVLDFMHHCVTLVSELGCSLVILIHEDIYPSGEAPQRRLLSNLEHLADVVIKTEPSYMGLSADVHVQLTIIRKTVFNEQDYSANKISNFHFKVKENGVDYFYPGSRH